MSETLKDRCDRLRKEMHEAPLNKVFQDHDGHRHLGTHSNAWATKSREWCDAVSELWAQEHRKANDA
jgi:hypothetical protein